MKRPSRKRPEAVETSGWSKREELARDRLRAAERERDACTERERAARDAFEEARQRSIVAQRQLDEAKHEAIQAMGAKGGPMGGWGVEPLKPMVRGTLLGGWPDENYQGPPLTKDEIRSYAQKGFFQCPACGRWSPRGMTGRAAHDSDCWRIDFAPGTLLSGDVCPIHPGQVVLADKGQVAHCKLCGP